MYIYIYIYTHNTCMHICVYVCIYMCIYIYIYTHIIYMLHAHVKVRVQACARAQAYTPDLRTQTCMHACTLSYAHWHACSVPRTERE